MAIVRIAEPANPPTAPADWGLMLELVRALARNIEHPLRWDNVSGASITKGAIFEIGGTIYLATSATAITGTGSNYIKIKPSADGATCSASFVVNLTGVTWNTTYNGYYDAGSPASLYIFDEAMAFKDSLITVFRKQADYRLGNGTGEHPLSNAVRNIGLNADMVDGYHPGIGNGMMLFKTIITTKTWNVLADVISVLHNVTASKIIAITASGSRADGNVMMHPFNAYQTPTIPSNHITGLFWDATTIYLTKADSEFDWGSGAMTITFTVMYIL